MVLTIRKTLAHEGLVVFRMGTVKVLLYTTIV